MKSMRMTARFVLVSLLIAGCGVSTGDGSPTGTGTGPAAPSGSAPPAAAGEGAAPAAPIGVGLEFTGTYEVPVPAELAAAASYRTPHIRWTVQGGIATLEYALPPGLVGGAVRVEFSGPVDPATGQGTLVGKVGSAECTATPNRVSCLEKMPGILPLTPDMALVEAAAKDEYAGPVQDRVRVTERFIGDPIGIVHFDPTTGGAPVDDSPAKASFED